MVVSLLLQSLLSDVTEAFDAVEAAINVAEKYDVYPEDAVNALQTAQRELFQARLILDDSLDLLTA